MFEKYLQLKVCPTYQSLSCETAINTEFESLPHQYILMYLYQTSLGQK